MGPVAGRSIPLPGSICAVMNPEKTRHGHGYTPPQAQAQKKWDRLPDRISHGHRYTTRPRHRHKKNPAPAQGRSGIL